MPVVYKSEKSRVKPPQGRRDVTPSRVPSAQFVSYRVVSRTTIETVGVLLVCSYGFKACCVYEPSAGRLRRWYYEVVEH